MFVCTLCERDTFLEPKLLSIYIGRIGYPFLPSCIKRQVVKDVSYRLYTIIWIPDIKYDSNKSVDLHDSVYNRLGRAE